MAAVLIGVTGAHALTLDQVIGKMNDYRAQNAANPAVLGASASATGSTEARLALPPEQSQVIVNDLRNVTGKLVQPIVTKQICYGSTDVENVKALQAFLSTKGYLDGSLITGKFYGKTAAALAQFQAKAGITGTGVGRCVGAQTQRALSVSY